MKLGIAFTIFFFAFGNYIVNAQNASKFSADDKYQIIMSILARTNFKGNESELEVICISKENLSNNVVKMFPTIKGIEFLFLKSIEKIEEPKCRFNFWYFSNFDLKKKSVLVSFIKAYQVDGFSSNSGLRYEYRKKKGKWEGKIFSYVLGIS